MYKEYLSKLYELLAIEFNCKLSDITDSKDVLTESVFDERARAYSADKPFFSMASLGGNALVTADAKLLDFLHSHLEKYSGHWVFQLDSLIIINEELNKYGYKLTPTHHMLLPCKEVKKSCYYPVKWFYDREIDRFYGDKRFTHALCEKYLSRRPDRIAVCAYDRDEIIGMAGCSEDAKGWLQIGIDVSPQYRGKGIGTALVSMMTNEIITRGGVPFYGTAVANYHSQRIALACGYKPTWVEVNAIKNKGE